MPTEDYLNIDYASERDFLTPTPAPRFSYHADSYFCIGAAHKSAGKPCQDYALSTADQAGKYAVGVISDGCSTGRHTDIGARMVGYTTLSTIERYLQSDQPPAHGSIMGMVAQTLPHRCYQIRHDIGLIASDMLATSLACFGSTDRISALLLGDGVVLTKYRDGSIAMCMYKWDRETPYYPAYGWSQEFISEHGGASSPALTVTYLCAQPEASLKDTYIEETQITVENGMRSINASYYVSTVECVAIFSDCITQIDGVPWYQAARDLLDFKTTAGEFVKRRAMAQIRKWEKEGRVLSDDFSMACVHAVQVQQKETV